MAVRYGCMIDQQATTEAIAAVVAELLQARDIVALSGDLGTGKSCFARSIIRTLAEDADLAVPSPTFNLVLPYSVKTRKSEAVGDREDWDESNVLDLLEVWHFDLYRLERADEVWELGLDEAMTRAISLIEWPERISNLLPRETLYCQFSLNADGCRWLHLAIDQFWNKRLESLLKSFDFIAEK